MAQAPIAVVGVSALFPGSVSRHGFWRDIMAGKDLITDVPATHWLIDDYYDPNPVARDKTYARRGAFLSDVQFDPVAWGMPPNLLPTTDTTQLLALIVAQQVLEDACGGQFHRINKERVSVILGVTSAQELLGSMVSRLQRPVWVKALREMGLPESQVNDACERIASHYVEWKESTFPGVLGNVVAGRIANRLDLGGTNCITDAACASSFSALSMAVSELRLGQSDLVITGGADTMNDIFMYICFSKTPALSPTGDCRPFSDQADGTLLGEGLGMVALKRLDDAERDGDHIYAVLKGVGSSSDGRSKSVYAPVSAGQAVALRRCYEQAGFGAETIELMEAHGTGTKAGDAAEFEGLRMVFEASGRRDRQWCALGSVKSQVGHTKAAAGAAGLFKAVMALHHKVLPPTIKARTPDPKLAIETTPFYLNTKARPWVRGNDHPRRAAVSSFGFGGSNFHLALEEYVGTAPLAARDFPAQGHLLLLADVSAHALATRCQELHGQVEAFVQTAPDEEAEFALLLFLAHQTQTKFEAQSAVRLSLFVTDCSDLLAKLEQAGHVVLAAVSVSAPGGLDFAAGPPDADVGFLFPGQGSQHLHMAADVLMAFPAAQEAWDSATSYERRHSPDAKPLHRIVFPPPAFTDAEEREQQAQLTQTQSAQPAIGVTSLALLNLLRTLQCKPAAVAGHSFGEVTALHAAGVLDHDAFLAVAQQRGKLMAAAATSPGSMLSVAAPIDQVRQLLKSAGHHNGEASVVVANHNSPRQVVLSGEVGPLAAVDKRLQAEGISTTKLDVATAFHSAVVATATVPFESFLSDIHFGPAVCPVYANTTAEPYPSDPAGMRSLLANQIAQGVRFAELIEAMYAQGIRTFVEVGPGHTLTALVGHILKDRPHRAVTLNRKGRAGVSTLLQGLGALAVAGVELDFTALWAPFALPLDPRLKTKPGLSLKVNGAGYGKPYPPPGGAAALPKPNPEVVPSSAPSPASGSAAPVNGATPHAAPVAALVGPTMHAAPALDPALQYAWVMAITESQRQTAEAHSAFQRAMAESHTAFLRSAEASLFGLTAALGGAGASTGFASMMGHAGSVQPAPAYAPPAPMFAHAPAPVFTPLQAPTFAQPPAPQMFAPPNVAAFVQPAPALSQAPATLFAPPAPMHAPPPTYAQPPVSTFMQAPVPVQPVAAPAVAQAAPSLTSTQPVPPAPTPVAASSALSIEALQALMLNIVAARTGYPEEMLGLDMDLEADLGVDSIKRVEILSAVMERAPALPEVNTAKMASMRTLREIVSYLAQQGGQSGDAQATNGHAGDAKLHTNGAMEGAHRPLGRETP